MTGTPITRRASCSCGQLMVLAMGEPVRVSVCHCLDCQKRSGSAFACQARYAQSQVQVEGASKAFVRVADSGNAATFNFCSNCGSTVFYTADAVPGCMTIPVGAFADPSFPPPRVSVYEERMHPWLQLSGDLERFDELAGRHVSAAQLEQVAMYFARYRNSKRERSCGMICIFRHTIQKLVQSLREAAATEFQVHRVQHWQLMEESNRLARE